MDEEKKPDLVLSDGCEINFDLRKISVREWRALFDGDTSTEEEDQIGARVAGLSVDEYLDLSLYDNKRFWIAFLQRSKEPADPN